jgi:hypothetical protein
MSLYISNEAIEPARIGSYRRRIPKSRFLPKPARPGKVSVGPTYEQVIASAAPTAANHLAQRA